jgi:hypothetical protein
MPSGRWSLHLKRDFAPPHEQLALASNWLSANAASFKSG